MGNGAGKKSKYGVQPEASKPPLKVEITLKNPTAAQAPPLPVVPSRQPSVQHHSPLLASQVSIKRRSSNLANGVQRRTPFRNLNNKTSQENDDVSLPSLDNQNKSTSRPSTRTSFVVPLPPVNRIRSDSDTSSESSKHKHRRGSISIHEHSGRCSKCPHCRRLDSVSSKPLTPQPSWLTKNPGNDQLRINMDEYDIEAVKNKIIAKNHHLLGSYDYQPYLTIEQTQGDYDPTKENYYTQPFIARTKPPTITPLRTPFPNYALLQRREQRLNKPYSLPLFD